MVFELLIFDQAQSITALWTWESGGIKLQDDVPLILGDDSDFTVKFDSGSTRLIISNDTPTELVRIVKSSGDINFNRHLFPISLGSSDLGSAAGEMRAAYFHEGANSGIFLGAGQEARIYSDVEGFLFETLAVINLRFKLRNRFIIDAVNDSNVILFDFNLTARTFDIGLAADPIAITHEGTITTTDTVIKQWNVEGFGIVHTLLQTGVNGNWSYNGTPNRAENNTTEITYLPVNLPDKATITKLQVDGQDADGNGSTVQLIRFRRSDHGTDTSAIVNLTTTSEETEDTSILNATVDNSLYAWYLRFFVVAGVTETRIFHVSIEYEQNKLN